MFGTLVVKLSQPYECFVFIKSTNPWTRQKTLVTTIFAVLSTSFQTLPLPLHFFSCLCFPPYSLTGCPRVQHDHQPQSPWSFNVYQKVIFSQWVDVKSKFFSTEVPVDLRSCVVIHRCSTLFVPSYIDPTDKKFHWYTSLKNPFHSW